ncbi:hypothetical protein GCM10028807_37060 [Spirosoma daeguense]
MALHVINLSIDTPDRYGKVTLRNDGGEDLSVNDIESFSELLLEVGLGLVNAVPEHDEPDDDSNLTKLEQTYLFANLFQLLPPRLLSVFIEAEPIPFKLTRALTHVVDILSPPPQHTC